MLHGSEAPDAQQVPFAAAPQATAGHPIPRASGLYKGALCSRGTGTARQSPLVVPLSRYLLVSPHTEYRVLGGIRAQARRAKMSMKAKFALDEQRTSDGDGQAEAGGEEDRVLSPTTHTQPRGRIGHLA